MIEYERLSWRRAFSTIERAREMMNQSNDSRYDSRHQRRSEIARRLLDWCRLDIERERSSTADELETPLLDWGRECCVIDLETTGLDPRAADITEIAVIRTDRHLRPIRELHVLVVPSRPWLAADNPWVLEHTRWGREGADPDRWLELGAYSLSDALKLIEPYLLDASPIAHFLPFEARWLRAVMGPRASIVAEQVKSDQWLRSSIDTRELSSPLRARRVCGRSLAQVCSTLGVDHTPHDALSDARACLEVARILLSGEI